MNTLEKIQAAAAKRGMSMEKLAEEVTKSGIKVAKSTIYRWDTSKPNPDKLKAVADVLGVSVDYLLGNSTPNRTPDEMTPIELDEALEQEGLVRFNGQPLSEGYKRAILSMLNTMKEEK